MEGLTGFVKHEVDQETNRFITHQYQIIEYNTIFKASFKISHGQNNQFKDYLSQCQHFWSMVDFLNVTEIG